MTHARPGPLNLITDVAGLSVGNAQDAAVRTGVTVLLADAQTVAAVDVCGGAPGTRETDALRAGGLVGAVDAIVLAGGSVYGLGAADGVTAALGARGRGYRLRDDGPPAPIVAAAILFDLANGGDKAWGEDPPYAALGREALDAAAADFGLGAVGAGCGAMAGTLKGGLGSASVVTADGITVGALAAVNSFGSVAAPEEALARAHVPIGRSLGTGRLPVAADATADMGAIASESGVTTYYWFVEGALSFSRSDEDETAAPKRIPLRPSLGPDRALGLVRELAARD